MSPSRAAATRSNLVRLRRRLEQVEKGAALLRRKRESLVAELFDRARPAIDSRQRIETQARTAWRSLLTAAATHGRDELRAVGWPSRTLRVELAPIEVWGLHAVELARRPQVVRSLGARGAAPEAAPAVAAAAFEELLELLLDAAPKEFLMRRLGHELSRATRLVNTLEQRVATGLHADLAHVRRTLEEREREEHLRLKRLIARRKAERQ
ncbi:MAG: V-type ATP synthase subunit D [Archangium sp.]|nr:V-type ATP synthase subunit D [Archangium sp.]